MGYGGALLIPRSPHGECSLLILRVNIISLLHSCAYSFFLCSFYYLLFNIHTASLFLVKLCFVNKNHNMDYIAKAIYVRLCFDSLQTFNS